MTDRDGLRWVCKQIINNSKLVFEKKELLSSIKDLQTYRDKVNKKDPIYKELNKLIQISNR